MALPPNIAPATPGAPAAGTRGITKEEQLVIFASSLGTVFEWYDFYLYGSLAAIIGKQFFSSLNETSAFIFALLAFAAGFAVRPFGAIFFGRLGDMIGRKYTFLVTILIMGMSTFIVGLLPSYGTIGVAAPVILIGLRMLQGLALGGEYGGAATYVAEHAPPGKRGFFTSFIQTTATVGLFLSLLVILACRNIMGASFDTWGWRIPFILSSVLLAISVYIRLKLSESPVFKKMKAEGKSSKAPLTESFLRWGNLKIVLLVLLGGTAGQGVVWYTGMFYELFFLQQTLKVEPSTANILVAIALVLATPFFIVFGALSDKIGRKHIIMAGCVIAAATYFPIFKALTKAANPDIAAAEASNPVTVVADPKDCSVQFDPIGKTQFTTSCDLVKSFLAKRAIAYTNESAPPGTVASAKVGSSVVVQSFPGRQLPPAEFKARNAAFQKQMTDTVNAAGYPTKADPNKINKVMVVFLLWILAIYVTLVYAPIAAWLVELFPARIRYTSMSLPYHIGNGWFGGFLPTIAFAMVAATGDVYYGLWYPIVIALMTAVVGTLFLPETHHRDIAHT
ncbi:MAG TPA: MFS transporter [Anaeromyxobacteraceae bacterium]|nr:MFS transporter [Anaeromyxobacteraceae bacterium]